MKLLSLIVSLAVFAGCSAVPAFTGKLNVSGIVYHEPDPAFGKMLSERDENSTMKAWEYGPCYTRRLKTGRNAVVNQASLWPNKKVYYIINPTYDAAQTSVIEQAINNIQSNTCIQFVKRTTQTDYIKIVGGNTGCWSVLGRVGGMQELNLQPDGCLSEIGTGVHEFLHALGVHHEQERSDRDDYINIHLENVQDQYKESFGKLSESEVTTFGLAYDFKSIMHYDKFSSSKNGQPVMTAKIADAPEVFGQIDGLTALDIAKLKALYSC